MLKLSRATGGSAASISDPLLLQQHFKVWRCVVELSLGKSPIWKKCLKHCQGTPINLFTHESLVCSGDLLKLCLLVRKMPRLMRPGTDDSSENVRCQSRSLFASAGWIDTEQDRSFREKIWMRERPLEPRPASSSEIIRVINIFLPAEQLQLLRPG